MFLFWPLSLTEPSSNVFHHSKPQCMILNGQTVGGFAVFLNKGSHCIYIHEVKSSLFSTNREGSITEENLCSFEKDRVCHRG